MRTAFLQTLTLAAGTTLAMLSGVQPAQAQYYGSYGNDNLIRCESRDGRTEYCNTSGGGARLVRQLSENPCVQGRTWGTDSRGIWVSQGCRAEFEVGSYGSGYGNGYGSGYGNGYDDGSFRCESRDGRTEYCATDGRRVRFVRQLSNNPCIEGRSWGTDSRGVWVSQGCRAEFSVDRAYSNDPRYDNGLFRCESRDGRTEHCDTNGRRAQLVRQLSNTPCVEGRTWGSDSRGVWVSQGCRAEFRSQTDNGYGNGQVFRCESNDGRSRECRIPAGLRGTVQLVRQLSSTPCTQGHSWGVAGNIVWVTRGCRAEFAVGRGHRRWWRSDEQPGAEPGQIPAN